MSQQPENGSESDTAGRSQAATIKSRINQGVFQAEASLDFLHHCRVARQGLIFDFEAPARSLRYYAFTAWPWNKSDIEYTGVFSRRTPQEFFGELPNDYFFLLSFCQIWHDPNSEKSYIPAALRGRLRREHQGNHPFADRHIIVLQSPQISRSIQRSWPLFAVPAKVVSERNKSDTSGTGNPKPFSLIPKHVLELYKFNDTKALIEHLAVALVKSKTTVSIGEHDIKVQAIARKALLEIMDSVDDNK